MQRNKHNLLTLILVAWLLSTGATLAWEFQSPISFEDDEPAIKKNIASRTP